MRSADRVRVRDREIHMSWAATDPHRLAALASSPFQGEDATALTRPLNGLNYRGSEGCPVLG